MKYLASSAFRPVLTKTVWLVNKHDVIVMHMQCVCTRERQQSKKQLIPLNPEHDSSSVFHVFFTIMSLF